LSLFFIFDRESPSLCQMGYERLEVVKEGRVQKEPRDL
ncbi:hypothetical protein DBR06_SOUSAS15710088, partial [Sousa chinensis]